MWVEVNFLFFWYMLIGIVGTVLLPYYVYWKVAGQLTKYIQERKLKSVRLFSPEILKIMAELDKEFKTAHQEVADKVIFVLRQIFPNVEVVGSVRRHHPHPNDVDILFLGNAGEEVVKELRWIADGDVVWQGNRYSLKVDGIPVHVIPALRWGMDMLTFTGSRMFNKKWESAAKAKGLTVEDRGGRTRILEITHHLVGWGYDAKTIKNVKEVDDSEEGILRLLDLSEYIDPVTRNLT